MITSNKKVSGKLIGKGDARFKELDRQIREVVSGFIGLGQSLIEMRTSQVYLSAGYSSWPEYCRSVEGLSDRHVRNIVRASLVYDAVAEGGTNGSTLEYLNVERKCRELANMATFEYEDFEVEDANGKRQVIRQPVGIKNPKAVQSQFQKTVREYEAETKRCEAEGKRPPKFSAKYIRNKLPYDKREGVDRRDWKKVNPLNRIGIRAEKLCDDMKQQKLATKTQLRKLISTDPKLIPELAIVAYNQMAELSNYLQEVAEVMDSMPEFGEDHE